MKNAMIDLEGEIKYISDQIVKKYKPEKIILFGSAAHGNFTKDSDLDFFIVKDDVPYYGVDRLKELDHLIDYNLPVDFIVYKPKEFAQCIKIGDPLTRDALKGRVLYG